jgi:hypothetical protein
MAQEASSCAARDRSYRSVNLDRDETTRMIYFSYVIAPHTSPSALRLLVSGRGALHHSDVRTVPARGFVGQRQYDLSTVHPAHRPADLQRQTGLRTGERVRLMVL